MNGDVLAIHGYGHRCGYFGDHSGEKSPLLQIGAEASKRPTGLSLQEYFAPCTLTVALKHKIECKSQIRRPRI